VKYFQTHIPGDDDDSEDERMSKEDKDETDVVSEAEAEGDGEGEGEEATDADGNRTEGEGGKKPEPGGKAGKRKHANSYDYMDDFIDDSEFIDFIEKTDKRKPKHHGFKIHKGAIDRTEEYLPGAEPPKPGRKKKADAVQAGAGHSGAPASSNDADKVSVYPPSIPQQTDESKMRVPLTFFYSFFFPFF